MNYIVIGTSRSGHHAIINWLCLQVGNITHLNGCFERDGVFVPENKITPYGKMPNKNILYSLENFDPVTFNKYKNMKVFKESSHKIIIVVRDAYNWIASHMKKWGSENHLYTRLVIWKHQVEECLYRKNISDITDINFNLWTLSKDYRMSISKKLGFLFTDAGFNTIPKFGSGSSFSNFKHDGKAQNLDVLNRHRFFKDDRLYKSLFFKNTYLTELTTKYFGENYVAL